MTEPRPTREYNATVTLRERPGDDTIDDLLDGLVGLGPAVGLSGTEANILLTVDAVDAESAATMARATVERHCAVQAVDAVLTADEPRL